MRTIYGDDPRRAQGQGFAIRGLGQEYSKYTGSYDPATIDDAIEEARDFVAVEMFDADEGWLTNIRFLDTVANQFIVKIPAGVAMIEGVRYKVGDVYMPMLYDSQSMQPQYDVSAGPVQYPYTYKLMGDSIYFNPPLAEGGVGYLQLDCMEYPKVMQDDGDFMEAQFDKAMEHFIKYKTASILAAGVEKFATPWATLEADCYKQMKTIIVKRNRQSQPIRDFGD